MHLHARPPRLPALPCSPLLALVPAGDRTGHKHASRPLRASLYPELARCDKRSLHGCLQWLPHAARLQRRLLANCGVFEPLRFIPWAQGLLPASPGNIPAIPCALPACLITSPPPPLPVVVQGWRGEARAAKRPEGHFERKRHSPPTSGTLL